MTTVRATTKLRRLLSGPGLIQAPGVVDAMTARVVAAEGYKAVYMTGSGTACFRLGALDVGLLTMTEMVDNAQRIAEAVDIPLISDADTGYGGPMNVVRTVRAFEKAGVAAIHIEDQQWPKRCGHFAGKSVIPADEMVSKMKAAVDSRRDADFVIIARTDAYSVEGFQATMDRAARYVEAGADMVFVEELRKTEELSEVTKRFKVPALFNMAASGKTPFLSPSAIQALGFKIVIYPTLIQRSAIYATQQVLRDLKREDANTKELLARTPSQDEWYGLLQMKEMQELELKYGVDEQFVTRRD